TRSGGSCVPRRLGPVGDRGRNRLGPPVSRHADEPAPFRRRQWRRSCRGAGGLLPCTAERQRVPVLGLSGLAPKTARSCRCARETPLGSPNEAAVVTAPPARPAVPGRRGSFRDRRAAGRAFLATRDPAVTWSV